MLGRKDPTGAARRDAGPLGVARAYPRLPGTSRAANTTRGTGCSSANRDTRARVPGSILGTPHRFAPHAAAAAHPLLTPGREASPRGNTTADHAEGLVLKATTWEFPIWIDGVLPKTHRSKGLRAVRVFKCL